jgi:hypothetical protein
VIAPAQRLLYIDYPPPSTLHIVACVIQTPRNIKNGEVEKWRFMEEVEVINGIGRDIIGKKFRRNFDHFSKGHSLAGLHSCDGTSVFGYTGRVTARAVHRTHGFRPHATPSPRSGAVTKRAT